MLNEPWLRASWGMMQYSPNVTQAAIIRSVIQEQLRFVGEYLERYCNSTQIPIDRVVLVATDIAPDVTVYQVQPLDMYPELWMEEHE